MFLMALGRRRRFNRETAMDDFLAGISDEAPSSEPVVAETESTPRDSKVFTA